jgi:hypothetical protein
LDIALFSDVEDIFNPPEFGNDDSIKELATILTEEGLRANFMVIGERALVLRERGRKDVIESLAPHEVRLHTSSAYHPEVPEYVAGKSWEDGVAECLRREREGTEIIRDVFGKPCVAPWPNIASPIGITYMKAVEGELMDPDTEVNTLYRDGKLQTWTLKPAVAI